MKAATFATLLLLTLHRGEALECNYCTSTESSLCTPTGTQTCSPFQNACGAVVMQTPISRSFRQCMNMAVCQGFIQSGAFAICCSTDLCN